MATDASAAFFSMTQAEYAAGNFKQKVAEGSMSARLRVGAGVDNVAGVKLPVFSKYDTGAVADNQSLGLVGGGKKIANVRDKFTVLLEMLIKYVYELFFCDVIFCVYLLLFSCLLSILGCFPSFCTYESNTSSFYLFNPNPTTTKDLLHYKQVLLR